MVLFRGVESGTNAKMEFLRFYLCLSIILGGCSAQPTTSSDSLGNSSLPVPQLATTAIVVGAAAPTTISTGTITENQTMMAPPSTPTTQVLNTDGSSANYTSKSASEATVSSASTTAGVTLNATSPVVASHSTTQTTTKRTKTNIVWVKSWDTPFVYDYSSLRHVGLGLAAIFFVTGILVLACERLSQVPKCHVSSRKTYEVVRV
ncbi:hypothetical protein AAFF_G00232870 [Aldrovandia affinis]|uniref:FXYD domain-containing ion transport regulator n=1 Tax=Aldrovandia affinis TaxID=143900 RepID=A0AAD7W4V2_9TELE|nr:hypothetical protein AAFF_G00232870 [Aldrovandia affinis]